MVADITKSETYDKIINKSVEQFSRVDVLVNNAGIFQTKTFTEYTLEELDGFLGYLWGTFVLPQATVRQMRKQGEGVLQLSTLV